MAQEQNERPEVEPYKLAEVFCIIPEYDGNQIFLQTFLNSCRCAYEIAVGNQVLLLTLHIKNKLRGKAAELVNSRNPSTWPEIKNLLETHFGDSRDLTSLIQDLQRISQHPNESPLNFVSRLQTHNAKMHAAIQKQPLTADQKLSQSHLIETMTLNTLLTGLDPKLGSIIRASNPRDMLQAIGRIKREIQLSYFESQKYSRPSHNPNMPKRPTPGSSQKICSLCKRTGHTINECRARQQPPPPNFQNFSRPNFQNNYVQPVTNHVRPQFNPNQMQNPQSMQNQPQRPQFNQNQSPRPQTSQYQQNRPMAIRPNPNINQQRPSIIRPNPNFNQPRIHHVNYLNNNNHYEQDYYNDNSYTDFQNFTPDNYYDETQDDLSYLGATAQNFDFNNAEYSNDYYNQEYTEQNQNYENETQDLCQNFQSLRTQDQPPGPQNNVQPIQTMNLNNQSQLTTEQSFI